MDGNQPGGGESSSGGLPDAAKERLAGIRKSGTWGSALSSDEFTAIRSVGFEPVGQVLGATVYNIGYVGYACPGAWAGYGGFAAPYRSVTAISGEGGIGSFGPLVRAMYAARHKAIDRMQAECIALGGHGVISASIEIGAFPAGGLEFRAIGTAVRAPGAPPLRKPFTSHMSGQDFAKLIIAGWVPVGFALGISVGARHDDWMTTRQTAWGSGNAEVNGYTELVNLARHDGRTQLERDVARQGGSGVVISGMDLHIRHRECPMQEHRRDHIAEVTITGTAIAEYAGRRPRADSSLTIMSLDPKRRQAARIKL